MKNVDLLYRLSNLISFFAMVVLFLDALKMFNDVAWFSVDWAFGILVVVVVILTIQAKRLDLRRNNPNLVVPISKYTYFISVGAFFTGYLFLEEQSQSQAISYGVALVFEVFSTLSSMIVMKQMKRKTQ
ncbi:MAG: hypothetical protein ACI9J3_003101 [Parvicellaceae bacterium]|jgi:hypothetical protein